MKLKGKKRKQDMTKLYLLEQKRGYTDKETRKQGKPLDMEFTKNYHRRALLTYLNRQILSHPDLMRRAEY